MSYPSRSGHGYGNQKRGSSKGFGKRSSKKPIDFQQVGFDPKDAVSTYTSNEAVDDGLLVDLDLVTYRKSMSPEKRQQAPLQFVTSNLMAKGYLNSDGSVNGANLWDLMEQGNRILSKMPQDDRFASGRIELPSGDKQQIFIAQNETGRFTIMLPEDY